MTRLTLALTAWLGVVSVAAASPTPRKDFPPFRGAVPEAVKLLGKVSEEPAAKGSRSGSCPFSEVWSAREWWFGRSRNFENWRSCAHGALLS
jgi:hypothetical protein